VAEIGAHLEHAVEQPETPARSPVDARRPDAGGSTSGAAIPVAALPLLHLQRTAGNAAVANLLGSAARSAVAPHREASRVHDAVHAATGHPSRLSVQRVLPDNYDTMSDTEKTAVIRDMVAREPANVYSAWKQLKGPLGVAQANPDLFAASVKIDDDILDLPAFDAVREDFKNDVLNKARGYLSGNKQAVDEERQKTGVPKSDGSVGGAVQTQVAILRGEGASAESDEAVQGIQKAAERMEAVKARKAKCRATVVGYSTQYVHGVGREPVERHVASRFNPGKPPEAWEPPAQQYEEVMGKWGELIKAEALLVKQNPSAAFFIGEGGDPTKLKDEKDIRVARAQIATALAELEGRIDKAIPMVGSDITFLDLVPIQQQLMGGTPGNSQRIWSKPVENAVAKEAISDANMADLLKTLGVGTLSAAFFIFAEILSGGSFTAFAPFLFAAGAGASAGQAAASWKDYTDLAAANKASINPEEMLVSGEQVDDAMMTAILDSIFAVVDGWQAVSGGMKAAAGGRALFEGGKAGATTGATAALRNLASAPDRAAVLAKAVQEVGLEEARRLSGLDFRQLAAIAGEKTDLGQRFSLLAEKGAGAMSEAAADLVAKLPKIAELSTTDGDQVLAAAVGQFGYKGTLAKVGGWKALRQTDAMKGATGKAFEGWRASVFSELAAWMEEESGRMSKAVRTGTEEATSDMDVQIVGGTAGELQQKAEGWLAGRMGTSSDRAKVLLDAEILVDPTRAHLIDLMKDIGEDARAQIQAEMATWEQQMIFGARLQKAGPEGSEAFEKVMADAKAKNVTPFKGFEPMSPGEQKRASTLIDGWMTELKNTKDTAERLSLAKRIGKTQAQINASHADAYVGGGVAIWVSGRDVDINKMAEALRLDPADLAKVTAAKRISAALSEGKWLDAAAAQLQSPKGATGKQLTGAVNNIGKHGARVAKVLQVEGKTNIGRLSQLMETLEGYRYMKVGELETIVKQGDLALLRQELDGLLGSLSGEADAAIAILRKDAATVEVSLADMAEFQSWLSWQGKYRAVADLARDATAAEVRVLETALQEAQRRSDQSVTPGVDYPVPPNQSVMPATGAAPGAPTPP